MRKAITVGRTSTGFCACVSAAFISVSPAGADATDDYPIPKRIWQTPCDAEQVLAAVRDTSPIYYERYMIDKSNRPADVQQDAVDRINWFFSLTPETSGPTRRRSPPTSTASRWLSGGATGRRHFSTTRASRPRPPMCA